MNTKMSNLIITIISIALVAITALLGIFYGGSAFSNYKFNTMANKWVNSIAQIAEAGALWRANYGVPSVCSPTSVQYTNSGICGGDELSYGWGGIDKDKYVFPIPFMDGTLPISYNGRYFNIHGFGPIVYNNVTYSGESSFNRDTQGDYYVLRIYKGDYVGSGNQTSLDPTDDFVKVCQKINTKATLPPSVTIDSDFNLPITTGTVTQYNPPLTNEIGPGICYLQKLGNSTTLMTYYVRL